MRHSSTIVAVGTLVFGVACGRDTTGPVDPDGVTMSARIDGVSWNATSIVIDSTPPSLLIVRGANPTESLTLVIPLNQGVGRQIVGSTTPIAAVLVNGAQWWAASRTQGGAGSIALTTAVPGHIAGTFEFTLSHDGTTPAERAVTSGMFDVRY